MNISVNTNAQDDRTKIMSTIKKTSSWDMLVIGGGITGAGIAREAARQGFNVLLLEQKDFAWGTSSRSSKMVHGGLRYLATGNLKLTSHSVKERERLMSEAPGLVDLQTYSWPHYKKKFPGPIVFNTLLAMYDFFAGKRYRYFKNKEETLYDLPGISDKGLLGATRFADALTDDARLVMRVLQEARRDGASVLNYCKVDGLLKESGKVIGVKVTDSVSGEPYDISAKVVINATGAWADQLRGELGKEKKIRPLRGSHLILPNWRLPSSQVISLSHPVDGRSMFVYPWEGMTVVGTTDLDSPEADLTEPSIQKEEVQYLLDAVNHLYPRLKITRNDIISSFAGVRPIVSGGARNPSSEKRDHSIWDDNGLISVSGGKLTTFRLIALDVLKTAGNYLEKIDGKDHGKSIFTQVENIPTALKRLGAYWSRRLTGFYGQDVQALCDCANGDWALVPGSKTFWAQIRFAARSENVVHLDDLLLRRTRVGLFLRSGGADFEGRLKAICQQELHWSDMQWQSEWSRYQELWHKSYSIPAQ